MTSAADQDVTAKNIAVVRAEHERLNRGDLQRAAELFSVDSSNQGRPVGRKGVLQGLQDIRRTFPDFRLEIVDMVAAGNTVAVRCKFSGTHEGMGTMPLNGGMLVGVAPTHKHFEVQHIHWYTLRDGQITDHYANRDDIGMMRQLGLLPPVAGAAVGPTK
jgi:predicted ester cyclase